MLNKLTNPTIITIWHPKKCSKFINKIQIHLTCKANSFRILQTRWICLESHPNSPSNKTSCRANKTISIYKPPISSLYLAMSDRTASKCSKMILFRQSKLHLWALVVTLKIKIISSWTTRFLQSSQNQTLTKSQTHHSSCQQVLAERELPLITRTRIQTRNKSVPAQFNRLSQFSQQGMIRVE